MELTQVQPCQIEQKLLEGVRPCVVAQELEVEITEVRTVLQRLRRSNQLPQRFNRGPSPKVTLETLEYLLFTEGLTQVECAERLGVSQATISRYANQIKLRHEAEDEQLPAT